MIQEHFWIEPTNEQVEGVQVASEGVYQLVDTDSITIEEAQ
jgi:hypothetical protein